jgi:hypothetical protein
MSDNTQTIIEITCSKTTVTMVLRSHIVIILIEFTIKITRLTIDAAIGFECDEEEKKSGLMGGNN